MRLHLWGTDFRRSTPEIRTLLFRGVEERKKLIMELLPLGFQDLVYLPTCNRVEFFTTAPDVFTDTRALWMRLMEKFGLPADTYFHGYHLEGKSALRHLIRVACSLESLVIGESQILGQLKDALAWTKKEDLPLDKGIERAFQLAFETAKKVRTETGLGERPVSVASLGMRHLELRESEIPLDRAVVVGTSPVSVLVIQWLQKNRPDCPIQWVNRTIGHLDQFPDIQGVERMALSSFLSSPNNFSHLFTATSSPQILFDVSFFEKLDPRPRVILDFAQPPDVDRRCVQNRLNHLVQLENLMEEARENAEARALAVHEAERKIEQALREFFLEQKELPILRDFSAVEPAVLHELHSAFVGLSDELPNEYLLKVQKWAEKLLKKQLHTSREHLRLVLRKEISPRDAAV